jgi:uncharacterized cupredoxin-like copper-binding protein
MNGTIALTALVLGLLVLSACGGADEPPVTTELRVTGTDALAFAPDVLAVPVGVEITLEFSAGPAVEHDFVIAGAAAHGMVGDQGHGAHGTNGHTMGTDDLHIAHADAGATSTATFMISEPGNYEVYCSVPGHRESGMTATLIVVDGT